MAISISKAKCITVVKDSAKVTTFGTVHLYVPETTIETVCIMISGDAGWKFGVLDFSEHFASKGALVIGVDILEYYKNLKARKEECYHIVADYVTLATDIEKKYNLKEYIEPLLMGYSSGATLVYAILAQARPNTFIGGISLGFCPDVELPKFFCELNGLKVQPLKEGKSYNLDPDSHLGNRWIVLQGKLDDICNYQNTADFIKQSSDAELIALDKVGHGFSKWTDFMPQWDNAFNSLLADDQEKSQSEKQDTAFSGKDLPLVVTESKKADPQTPFTIFISGDGGWYSFEQNLANRFATSGIPTAGLDAKKYFWNRRTPEESANDIASVLNFFSAKWQKKEVILIGYSMGAEVLPFIIEKLPSGIRSKISKTVLLSPGTKADFEIHLTNMLGLGNWNNTYDVVNELKQTDSLVPYLIITGTDEDSPLPTQLSESRIQFAKVPGDHHYNNDSQMIFNTLREKNVIQ